MILTCPACATRYFVDADRLGAEGRTVRCSSCAASWKAEPSPEPLELKPAAGKKAARIKPEVAPAAPGPVHRSFRDQVQAKRKTREAVAAGVVWAVLAAGFALVMLCAVIFRVQVVNAWPSTAGAYAFLRMPVNPTGFSIEEVQGGPALTDGRMAIVASGMLRNERNDAHAAPAVRVSLFDNAGRRLASQVVPQPAQRVAPGDARAFKASFIDPPSASHVQVEFAFEAGRAARIAAKPPADGLRGPAQGGHAQPPSHGADVHAAEQAKPLAPTSPYALHPVPHG